jgi:hypothetical protein
MEQFTQLFGRLLALVYHCFDRIVILGHLPLLTRPENIVHFFRDVHGVRAITKEVLREPTDGASSTCSPHETSEGGILRAKPQESNPRNGRSAPRRYAHHGRLWGGGDLGE